MFDSLKPLLTNKTAAILFVGIGNRLKSDDAIGIYICENLQTSNNIKTLLVEASIEKYVGKINSLAPDILVLTDCTDFNENPGFFKMLEIHEMPDNTFHTHTVSLRRISEFFEMKVFLLGVQPKNVKFGEEFTQPVQAAADKIIAWINQNLIQSC